MGHRGKPVHDYITFTQLPSTRSDCGKIYMVLEQNAELCEYCDDEFQLVRQDGREVLVFKDDEDICMVLATSEQTGELVLRLTFCGVHGGDGLEFSLEENPVLYERI